MKISTRKARDIREGIMAADNMSFSAHMITESMLQVQGMAAIGLIEAIVGMIHTGIIKSAKPRVRKVYLIHSHRLAERDMRSMVSNIMERTKDALLDEALDNILREANDQ